jgi:LacI family transcriptional regulator
MNHLNNNKRPTIKQVAAASGVSTQTVSRVINKRPDVAPETRDRVMNVINEMGYQPSALARSLIQQRSYTLGVITAGLKFIGPSRTLNGITSAAEEAGYSLILKELPRFTTDNVRPIFNGLISRHVDGIIWAAPEIGTNRDWVENFDFASNVPIVFLTMEPREGIPIISVDNRLGGEIATKHLLEKGYHQIGHISGPLDWWEARQRFNAWKATVTAAGQTNVDQHWVEGNWSSSSGFEAAEKLFNQYPEMDAIFAANDQMALGAMTVIHQKGIRVPEDFGVVGFDNIAESEYFWPALTTMQHDQHQVGDMAVKEIIRIIETIRKKETPEYKTIMLSPEILIRRSSLRYGKGSEPNH